MELELDLRKFSAMMVDDRQETVVKEYGIADSQVVTNDELTTYRLRRKAGGGNPPGNNWLAGMAWGTQFFARPKGANNWMLAKFMLAGVKKNVYLIIPMKGDEDSVADDREWFPVESNAFCNYWELVADFPPPEDI